MQDEGLTPDTHLFELSDSRVLTKGEIVCCFEVNSNFFVGEEVEKNNGDDEKSEVLNKEIEIKKEVVDIDPLEEEKIENENHEVRASQSDADHLEPEVSWVFLCIFVGNIGCRMRV